MAIDDHVADAGNYLKNIAKAEVHSFKTNFIYNAIQGAAILGLAYVGGVIGYNYGVGEALSSGWTAATTVLGAGLGAYAAKIITFPIDVIQFFKHWYARGRAILGRPYDPKGAEKNPEERAKTEPKYEMKPAAT